MLHVPKKKRDCLLELNFIKEPRAKNSPKVITGVKQGKVRGEGG